MVKRGFKAWCERTAGQYRKIIGITEAAPLCAWELAAHLGVTIKTPDQIPDLSKGTTKLLLNESESSWSAVTIFHNNKYWVILNSSHSTNRQSNDLMHELSHIICSHEPSRLDVNENGWLVLLSYNLTQEEEADILAATLLLPRVALIYISKNKLGVDATTKKYKVSKALFHMRMHVSGVHKQIAYNK